MLQKSVRRIFVHSKRQRKLDWDGRMQLFSRVLRKKTAQTCQLELRDTSSRTDERTHIIYPGQEQLHLQGQK